MTTALPDMVLNGETLVPDPGGALYWPRRKTLVVADLHLEKGSHFASKGQLLPPYDTRATLAALGQAIDRRKPERVISLGDSIDDMAAGQRIAKQDAEFLRGLTEATDWIWISGNHDPAPPAIWGGEAMADLVEGPFHFKHQAGGAFSPGEISGHFHPKASVSTRGRRISARCFIEDGSRLILPSFGAYTGGLDIFDPAFAPLFPQKARIWLLGRDRLHCFDRAALRR